MSFTSLYTLVAFYHRHLNELMLLHQEALLLQKTALATAYLDFFSEMLAAHIAFENENLLPLLADCEEPRWPAMLYEKEHDKVLAMLKKIAAMLQNLSFLEGRVARRAIIELLDYERSFKNVMEHHEEREEMALLKELDQRIATNDCRALIEKAQSLWHPLFIAQQQGIEHLHAEMIVKIEQ